MFAEEFSLWTGGPVLTLGDYFIWVRYLLCFLFLVWGSFVFRRPSGAAVLLGALLIGIVSWMALDLPLERPYGLTEESVALDGLGEAMVAASTRSPAPSVRVEEPSRRPFWGFLLALCSGFDPDRLLSLYPWVPLASLVVLALATYAAADGLTARAVPPVRGMAPALSVFFALFLSVPRLSFLESEGDLWTEAFWLRPRLGFGLALSLVAFRCFARASRIRDHLLGGLFLGVAAWTDPLWLLLCGVGVLLWAVLQWRRGEPVWSSWVGVGVGIGLYLLWPSQASSSPPVPGDGSWYGTVNRLLSVSLDQGAVFYLAVLAIVLSYRDRRRESLLFVWWILSAYAFWIAASFSEDAASLLDRAIVKSFLRVLLAVAAGWGAHLVLVRLDEMWKPPWLRGRSTYVAGASALLALSLPWVFPFWWSPVRMDPVYVESCAPVPREVLAFSQWIRENTPRDAVFAAGPSYAPWIPALSGRRVLGDDEALERLAASRDPEAIRAVAERFGVTHLAWGRLDAGGAVEVDFDFLNSSPLFSLVHQQRRWVRVYEIRTSR